MAEDGSQKTLGRLAAVVLGIAAIAGAAATLISSVTSLRDAWCNNIGAFCSTKENTISLGSHQLISHFLGEPILGFSVRIVNNSARPLEIRDLAVDARSPDGSSNVFMIGLTTRSETGDAVQPNMLLQPTEAFDYYLWWAPIPWTILGVAQTQEIKSLPEYATKWPCFNNEPLSANAVTKLKESSAAAFIWVAGPWTFDLSGKLGEARFKKKWTVTLDQTDINRMKAIFPHYQECWGVSTNSFLFNNGSVVTFFLTCLPPPVCPPTLSAKG
jgi:hypothetical protein